MSDKDDAVNISPLSSSSSGSSGTRARGVSIDDHHEKGHDTQPHSTDKPNSDSEAILNADNENSPTSTESWAESAIEEDSAGDLTDIPAEVEPNLASYADEQPDQIVDAPENEAFSEDAQSEDTFDAESASGDELHTETAAEETSGYSVETDAPAEDGHISTPADQDQSIEELRQAVIDSLSESEARNKEARTVFEQFSRDVSTMMKTARDDAAILGFKLMEYAQASVHTNFELARAYSEARTIPDIFNLQAEYLKRQLELLNSHTNEVRALTSELAAKTTAELRNRPER